MRPRCEAKRKAELGQALTLGLVRGALWAGVRGGVLAGSEP